MVTNGSGSSSHLTYSEAGGHRQKAFFSKPRSFFQGTNLFLDDFLVTPNCKEGAGNGVNGKKEQNSHDWLLTNSS